MKLTSARLDQALSQIDAEPLPESHPAMQRFNELFGEHTFLLDDSGLNIVEPVAVEDGLETGQVIRLASWTDESHTGLARHEPEFTDIVVVLGKAA
jgi:hypothetical protein